MAGFGLRSRPRVYRGNPNSISQSTLVAAGFRVTKKDSSVDTLRRLIQPWQARSFSYYDQLGEINYASEFYARMLAPLRLYPARQDENGEWIEIEPGAVDDNGNPVSLSRDDELAYDALDRIRDPGGSGREGLLDAYGRLMFLVGECYLLCTLDVETGLEQWEMLSTDELRVQAGVIMRYRAPSLTAVEYQESDDDDWEPIDDDHAIVYRIWQRHPRYSWLARSTMAGVLDICEELLLLTRQVRSSVRSRIATRGILAISEDFSYAPLEATPDEDLREDPFFADFIAAGMTAIQDEGAASAAFPVLLRGPTGAIKDGIKHIKLADQSDLYPETGLRYELIQRLAIGLDMPPEILLGLMDANHWTGWMIDEQTWKHHGMPKANQLVSDLNVSYYQPQLREDGVKDWVNYAIRYDATAIINHPDRTKDAKDLFDRVVIGKKALREAAGFDDDDAPNEQERAERLGILTHDPSLAWYGEPSVKAGGVEVAPGQIVSPTAGGEIGAGGGADVGSEVEPGPPEGDGSGEEPTAVVGSGNGNGDAPTNHREFVHKVALSRTIGAVHAGLIRSREVAGNRLLSLAKKDPELLAELENVPTWDVPGYIGAERARELGARDARELVAPARITLERTLKTWMKPNAAMTIAEYVERHAAKTLFDPTPAPLPRNFEAYVDGVVSAR